ncbi:hypothetical protein GOODEAATRI_020964 [Goodea atripinnis]|uniref:Uncharacterized protein n=1 Tax=Goodea atripinnis TaxID=208336 RepID=A0ABV0NZ24_9TELE
MSDLEARVCAILDVMVTATVLFQMWRPVYLIQDFCVFLFQVMQFSVFLESLAQEAVEKICQLFEECSSLLRLEVHNQLSPSAYVVLHLGGLDFKAPCWCCRCRRAPRRSKT